MFYRLQVHSDSKPANVSRVDAEIVRLPSTFKLRYRVSGSVTELKLPPPAAPQRTDELWKHTCCEVFFGVSGSDAYTEFNFSPSTEWAAYRFTGYRAGMSPLELSARPPIALQRNATMFEVQCEVPLTSVAPGHLRLGLAAIIEEVSGQKSYWALAHPPGKPDFHHAGSFVDLAE